MNKLEQLIQELCPHGVEYKKLGEVCKIKNGQDYKKLKQGDIPVYGSGGIMTYVDTSIYDKPSVLIPRKGSLKNIFYVENGFWNVDTIFYTEINSVYYVEKFFYYLIKQIDLEKFNFAGGVPSLTQSVLNKIMLPIPPLEIQKEIVRILDTFMELEKELEKELEARKKQYEFYREQLFTFDSSVNWSKLKELAVIGTGSSNTNEEVENGIYPFYVRSQDVRRKNSYEFDETAIITAGDGVGVGKVFHYVEGKYALHQRAYRIFITSDKLFPKFFFHFMKNTFLSYITSSSFHSSVTSIRKPMLENYLIPLPPLEEQERIVNILDRFDALCNDLTCGLPAEIEARKKQYAYYRDKLLTFKNISDKNIA